MKAFDFTTYGRDASLFTPANLAALKAQGYDLAIVGMDSSIASVNIVRTILTAGFMWDAYRFVYASRGDPTPDIDDLRAGILAVYNQTGALRDLPGVAWLDIEQDPQLGSLPIPTQQQCLAAANRLLYWQIGPGNITQAGVYSASWVWQQAGWGNWSDLANMGMLLWAANNTLNFGGWAGGQVAGYQTAWNQQSPIGLIDSSTMRDRSIALLRQPF